MTQLLTWFKTIFSEQSYSQKLDAFIQSKQPTNVAEIEYWANQFQDHYYGRIL